MQHHFRQARSIALLTLLSLSSAYSANNQEKNSIVTPAESINPSVHPYAERKVNYFMTGAFLWWKAIQDDLYYVSSLCTDTCAGNLFVNSYDGDVHDPSFEWDPGFELGIGCNLPYDGWDLYVNWTRFYTTASNRQCAALCPREEISAATGIAFLAGANCVSCSSSATPTNQSISSLGSTNAACTSDCCCDRILLSTFAPLSTEDQYATTIGAKAKWHLKLNLLDGELGREFYVSPKLTMRPFIGLRGAFISQTLNVNYTNQIHITNPLNVGYQINSASFEGKSLSCNDFQNDFQGVGPRFGLNTDWLLGKGFSIYANAAISLIFGTFDVHAYSNINISGEFEADIVGRSPLSACISEPVCIRLRDHFNSTKAATDLGLGLQYETMIKNQVHFIAQIGWDHHLFFNQNQLIQLSEQFNPFPVVPLVPAAIQQFFPNLTTTQAIVQPRRNGDLSLQGLILSLRLDY